MKFKRFPYEYQLDAMDCGPAALKIIAKYFGKYYSLQYLRDLCGITREGVSFLDLSYGAEKIGLHTLAVQASVKDLQLKVPLPCIVHWKNSHFVVVYRCSKNRVYVSDPAKGLLSYSHPEFEQGWYKAGDETGALLAIEPMADFLQRDLEEKNGTQKDIRKHIRLFRPLQTKFRNNICCYDHRHCLAGNFTFYIKSGD